MVKHHQQKLSWRWLFYVLFLFCVLCFVFCVLCFIFCVLCVLCFVFCSVLCFVLFCVLFFVFCFLCLFLTSKIDCRRMQATNLEPISRGIKRENSIHRNDSFNRRCKFGSSSIVEMQVCDRMGRCRLMFPLLFNFILKRKTEFGSHSRLPDRVSDLYEPSDKCCSFQSTRWRKSLLLAHFMHGLSSLEHRLRSKFYSENYARPKVHVQKEIWISNKRKLRT